MSKIGIIAALPAEAKCLSNGKLHVGLPLEIHKNIFLCLSGIGHDAALVSAKKLATLKIDALISWGVAGAIDNSAKSGDLILPRSIINNDSHYNISENWLNNITTYFDNSQQKIISGNITSSNKICATTKDKSYLSETTGAVAVDMESAAVAEVATMNKLDFLVLRAISDNAETVIPEAVLNHTDQMGRPEIFSFILSCITKPKQIKEITKLASGFKQGLATLSANSDALKNSHFFYSRS